MFSIAVRRTASAGVRPAGHLALPDPQSLPALLHSSTEPFQLVVAVTASFSFLPQWGSSEVWETLLQHKKEREDYCSVANLYEAVLAVPTPNLEQFRDEALVFLSNVCDEATERDNAAAVIEELFESTRKKKELLNVFESLLDANSGDLEVWKRYVEKVEEIFEGEEGKAMAVINIAFRAIVSCGDQEDFWFWLVERELQVTFDLNE